MCYRGVAIPAFGYRNVRGRDGVRREINEQHAPVIREIFERCARGERFRKIAHALNDRGAPSPKPRRTSMIG